MRLELGNRVDCTDGTFGELVDVVIDPITHLVLEQGHPWERHEVAIPMGSVATVGTDTIEVRRWSRPVGHGSSRH